MEFDDPAPRDQAGDPAVEWPSFWPVARDCLALPLNRWAYRLARLCEAAREG